MSRFSIARAARSARPAAGGRAAPSAATAPAAPDRSALTGLEKFRDHFLTIVFESSIWEGRRQVRGLEATFNGEALDAGRVGKPPAALMPPDLESRIRRARQRFYDAIAAYTLPVDQAGSRIVPVRRLADFRVEVDTAIAGFNEAADAVADAYDRIVAHNEDYWLPRCRVDVTGRALGPPREASSASEERALVSELSESESEPAIDPVATRARYDATIGHLIPARESFRALFRCGYRFPDPSAIASRFEDPGVREFLERANKAALAHAQDVVRMVVEEPTRRLVQALHALRVRLSDRAESSRLTPSTFSEVGQAVSLLLSCGDAIAPGLRQSVEDLEKRLAAVSEQASDAKLAGETYTGAIRDAAPALLAAIDRLTAQTEDRVARAEVLERFGVAPRKLRFRK
jgi:hypothetical protein